MKPETQTDLIGQLAAEVLKLRSRVETLEKGLKFCAEALDEIRKVQNGETPKPEA